MKVRVIALLVVATVLVHAQTPESSFEVASVRRNTNVGPGFSIDPRPGGRLVITSMTLDSIVGMAFEVSRDRVFGGPGWIHRERFDINAKASEGSVLAGSSSASPAPYILMLRSLLADRFDLRAHSEPRDLQAQILVVARADGKLGPRLIPTSVGCSAQAGGNATTTPPSSSEKDDPKPCTWKKSPGRLVGRAVTIASLVNMITNPNRPLVFNETNLAGRFDIDLAYAPEQTTLPDTGAAADLPVFVTALQEQLGLKLEFAKRSIQVVVIDSVSSVKPN